MPKIPETEMGKNVSPNSIWSLAFSVGNIGGEKTKANCLETTSENSYKC